MNFSQNEGNEYIAFCSVAARMCLPIIINIFASSTDCCNDNKSTTTMSTWFWHSNDSIDIVDTGPILEASTCKDDDYVDDNVLGVVKENHDGVCVRGSDHWVLVSEASGVMEAHHHSRISLFLVSVNCGSLTRQILKTPPRRSALSQGHPVHPGRHNAAYRWWPRNTSCSRLTPYIVCQSPRKVAAREFREDYSGRTSEQEPIRLQDVPRK